MMIGMVLYTRRICNVILPSSCDAVLYNHGIAFGIRVRLPGDDAPQVSDDSSNLYSAGPGSRD